MAFAAALFFATENVVARAERYIHPANAFSIEWPQGWQVQSTVDRSGFPLYGATPDGKSAKPKAGLWIFAVPIATDQGLDETKVARLVGRIISGEEPGLTFSPETVDANPSEVDFLSYGSGFFVSPEGRVLTNRHVVEQSFGGKFERETFDPVLVSFDHTFTRETYTADVLAVSYQYDLALLKIRENRPWKSLPAVNFDNVRRGDPITVVGWPAPETYSKTDLNRNDGTITAIEHDPRGRAVSVRHGAQTTA